MTKRELLQKYGTDAVQMASSAIFHFALDATREDCPYVKGAGAVDATAIIRNEGRMTGWIECLQYLKNIALSEREAPKVVAGPLYKDPDQTKSDQNKK